MSRDEILKELAQTRTSIARDYLAASEELNFSRKLERSIRSRPWAWAGGAAALGWLVAGPRRVRKAPAKKGGKSSDKSASWTFSGFLGLLLAALKIAAPMLKPAVSAYAARRLADLASKFGN